MGFPPFFRGHNTFVYDCTAGWFIIEKNNLNTLTLTIKSIRGSTLITTMTYDLNYIPYRLGYASSTSRVTYHTRYVKFRHVSIGRRNYGNKYYINYNKQASPSIILHRLIILGEALGGGCT